MYFPECFAMNAGISAMYFLKPPKSFTDKSSTKYRGLAEILALDQSDASEIEQVRAPAAARQPHRQLRSEQQEYRGHRQRDGAEPIQPHRRQLFGAVGIWSGAGQQAPALAQNIAPLAA